MQMENIDTRVYKADVAVIGCGAMGSATCSHLSRRGVSVIGIEQFKRGHDRGSSTGYTRLFRSNQQQHPSFSPLALEAKK